LPRDAWTRAIVHTSPVTAALHWPVKSENALALLVKLLLVFSTKTKEFKKNVSEK